MTRWTLVAALLADPVAVSRSPVDLLAALPAARRVHRIRDDRGGEVRRRAPGLTTGQRQIVDALAAGPLRPRELAAVLGRSPGACRFALGQMARAGLLERRPDGRYVVMHAAEVDA